MPLNGTRDADQINFFKYWLKVDQKVTYHNSWVTDQTVSKQNVVELVKAGRARCKIENETFNTLKNQGYHLEHIASYTRSVTTDGGYLLPPPCYPLLCLTY